jgi:hypothetical protein
MLVLVPGPLGGMRCFERQKPGPLRAGINLGDPLELLQPGFDLTL